MRLSGEWQGDEEKEDQVETLVVLSNVAEYSGKNVHVFRSKVYKR